MMIDSVIYYGEVNIIVIAVMAFLLKYIKTESYGGQSSTSILKSVIYAEISICVSDFLAVLLRGRTFITARALIQICNIVYIVMGFGIAILWFIYVINEVTGERHYRLVRIVGIPSVVCAIAVILNPVHQFFFSIDENNFYVRGKGIALNWIIMFGYMLAATVIAFRKYIKTDDPDEKDKCRGLVLFVVPCLISLIIQMNIYGMTVTQVGIMLSLLMVFLNSESRNIQEDMLTGLRNRRGSKRFIYSATRRNASDNIGVILSDIDNMSIINSNYGRIEGDEVIKTVAAIVNSVASEYDNDISVCRYAGDVIMIVGVDLSEDDLKNIEAEIHESITEDNNISFRDYNISVTTGLVAGYAKTQKAVEKLIAEAEKIVHEKKQH